MLQSPIFAPSSAGCVRRRLTSPPPPPMTSTWHLTELMPPTVAICPPPRDPRDVWAESRIPLSDSVTVDTLTSLRPIYKETRCDRAVKHLPVLSGPIQSCLVSPGLSLQWPSCFVRCCWSPWRRWSQPRGRPQSTRRATSTWSRFSPAGVSRPCIAPSTRWEVWSAICTRPRCPRNCSSDVLSSINQWSKTFCLNRWVLDSSVSYNSMS